MGSKFREFWLEIDPNCTGHIGDAYIEQQTSTDIHVIEYQALASKDAEIKRLREALEFYAEGKNYYDPNEDDWSKPGDVGWTNEAWPIEIQDDGKVAREALEEFNNETKETI